MVRARAVVAWLLAAASATGCSLVTDSFATNDFSGDSFPIQVETLSGAVIVGVRERGAEDRVAVLDLLSPVTLEDAGPSAPLSVKTTDLVLLGQRGAGGPLDLPRAALREVQVLSVHPCTDAECAVGPQSLPRPYGAIVGADALAGDAVRLRLGDEQLFVLADVGGDEAARTGMCDAVFPTPYRGGGTLIIAGAELTFTGRRIAIPSCLGPDPDPTLPQSQRGADALLVVSTGIGVTILSESAYQRYVNATARAGVVAPDLGSLPVDTIYLPSGPASGRRTAIESLALVATSTVTPRAPCRQVFGSHFLVTRSCDGEPGEDCPCEGSETFCSMPAVVELAPVTGVDVLIVPDADATLQALRTELHPDQPDVDGIIGTSALRTLELDIDYPHNRVLARCTTAECSTRPAMTEESDRAGAQRCLAN